MTFHILDIASVAVIGILATFWLIKSLIKPGNKCLTICNGCSGGSNCSTKNFSMTPPQSKPIKFYH